MSEKSLQEMARMNNRITKKLYAEIKEKDEMLKAQADYIFILERALADKTEEVKIRKKDADLLKQRIEYYYSHTGDQTTNAEHYAYGVALKEIDKLPTADVVDAKHGRWIRHFDDLFPAESTQECSLCHEEEFMDLLNENFCPNCGAKMDGGKAE